MFVDRKYRKARIWSNRELEKFSRKFKGKVVNVSAWKDEDKEGNKYRSYFMNASEYWITNYKSEAKGFQGDLENEIYLDLEEELSQNLKERFDVVFSHTVLEHVFEINKGFENLCAMSTDIVVVVVPFLQEQHGDYGDFWRLTPKAVEGLFRKNSMDLLYINYNDSHKDSIYIFAIGSKKADLYSDILKENGNKLNLISKHMIGKNIIKNSLLTRIIYKLKSAFSKD